MGRPGYLLLPTLLLIIIGFIACNVDAAEPQRVVLATGEWPPYVSKRMKNKGIFTEVVTAVFKEMGMKPVYRFYPWKRVEEEVRNGRAYASFPHVITPERSKVFHFSDSIMFSNGRMFYNTRKYPNGIEFVDMHDLKRYTVGGGTSYRHEDMLRDLGLTIEYLPCEDQNIRKLFLGRLDLLPLDETAGLYNIRRVYPRRVHHFAFAEKPLTQDSLHLMISTEYPCSTRIEREFSQAFKRIKDNGVYRDICTRYGIITTSCKTPMHTGGEGFKSER